MSKKCPRCDETVESLDNNICPDCDYSHCEYCDLKCAKERKLKYAQKKMIERASRIAQDFIEKNRPKPKRRSRGFSTSPPEHLDYLLMRRV